MNSTKILRALETKKEGKLVGKSKKIFDLTGKSISQWLAIAKVVKSTINDELDFGDNFHSSIIKLAIHNLVIKGSKENIMVSSVLSILMDDMTVPGFRNKIYSLGDPFNIINMETGTDYDKWVSICKKLIDDINKKWDNPISDTHEFRQLVLEMILFGNSNEVKVGHLLNLIYIDDIFHKTLTKKTKKGRCIGILMNGKRCSTSCKSTLRCKRHVGQIGILHLSCSGKDDTSCHKKAKVAIYSTTHNIGTLCIFPCKNHTKKIKTSIRCLGYNKNGDRCKRRCQHKNLCHTHKNHVGTTILKCHTKDCGRKNRVAVRKQGDNSLIHDTFICNGHTKKMLNPDNKNYKKFKAKFLKDKIPFLPYINILGISYVLDKLSKCKNCDKDGPGPYGFFCKDCSSNETFKMLARCSGTAKHHHQCRRIKHGDGTIVNTPTLLCHNHI